MKSVKSFVSKRNGVSRIKRDSYSNPTVSWWDINKKVRARDCNSCVSCKASLAKGTGDVHHIQPLSRGGVTAMSNLILLCDTCHKARHKHM